MNHALLISVFVIASCGLIYELVAGALASYLLGDSVTQFSTIIGTYLFAMGIGSWLSRYIVRGLIARFIQVELAVGVHVIGMRAPGFAPVVEPFEVGPETSLIALELPPDRGAIAAARAQADGFAALGERDAAALLDAIVSYTEADAVVLVAATVRTGGPALLGQRCHSGATCTAVVEVGYPIGGDLARAIALLRQRLADADHRYRPSLAGDPRLRPTGGPPVGGGGDGGARRRWLWIGGGAVLAAVAAVAITAWASGDDRPTVTVDPDDFTR